MGYFSVRQVSIETMSIVAILSPLLESESLSKKKEVWGTSMSVGETGGSFQKRLDMVKHVAMNSSSMLRECVRMDDTVDERTGINK